MTRQNIINICLIILLHFMKGTCTGIVDYSNVATYRYCAKDRFLCTNPMNMYDACIPSSYVCDGHDDCGDFSDERNCDSRGTPAPAIVVKQDIRDIFRVNEARNGVTRYMLNFKRPIATTNKWKLHAHRISIGLYFQDEMFFGPENKTGDELRYEITIQTLINLLEKDKFRTSELAMFVNAMLVSCLNPKDFHGYNLVSELRERVEKKNLTNPYEMLVLCNAGDIKEPRDVERISSLFASQKLKIDNQAMAIMALSCISNKSDVVTNVTESLKMEWIQELKMSQTRNGSIGSIKETATALQALIATDNLSEGFNVTAAINSILSAQKADGSFGSILNSYYVLVVLNHKSLAGINQDHCSQEHLTRDEIMKFYLKKKTVNVRTQISVIIGNDLNFKKSWTLNVSENTSLYNVIEQVFSMDSKFKVEYSISDGKPFISVISGTENDLELGLYWFTYIVNHNSTDNFTLVEKSPVDVKVEPNQEYIFWYKNES